MKPLSQAELNIWISFLLLPALAYVFYNIQYLYTLHLIWWSGFIFFLGDHGCKVSPPYGGDLVSASDSRGELGWYKRSRANRLQLLISWLLNGFQRILTKKHLSSGIPCVSTALLYKFLVQKRRISGTPNLSQYQSDHETTLKQFSKEGSWLCWFLDVHSFHPAKEVPWLLADLRNINVYLELTMGFSGRESAHESLGRFGASYADTFFVFPQLAVILVLLIDNSSRSDDHQLVWLGTLYISLDELLWFFTPTFFCY